MHYLTICLIAAHSFISTHVGVLVWLIRLVPWPSARTPVVYLCICVCAHARARAIILLASINIDMTF